MTIRYSKAAIKVLARMEKKLRTRIIEAIDGLTQTPPVGDIKPMEGLPEGRYRLRIGSYRVIYRYDEDGSAIILFVMEIGSRGDIYK